MTESERRKVDARILVETPEGVDFQFTIAGPGKRGTAMAIDLAIKLGIVSASLFALIFAGAVVGEEVISGTLGIWLVIQFLLAWFYGSFFEAFWNGQTPGKRSMALRVVRTNGTAITPVSAVGRNFLLVADCQPSMLCTVGILSMLMNRRMQRIGDLVFDTMVIDESRDLLPRSANAADGVEVLARSECTGRFSVPERTLAVVERLFDDDRIVPDLRREEIARPLSLALRQRLGFSEEGPDPRNPHQYFQQVPLKHTVFLRRILRTFGDQPEDSRARLATSQSRSSENAHLRVQPLPRRRRVLSQDRHSESLDEWLTSEAAEKLDTDGDVEDRRQQTNR
jgi:uncharacterized RDD family membrane protein YckC